MNDVVGQALARVEAEVMRAGMKHPVLHSRHEGLAVLEEEFEEAKEAVFRNHPNADLLAELVQTAAMAVRMIVDLDLQHKAELGI